ncbi:hypothetical protein [Arthrobacter oryzae]|uniref:hypothetical protein n=1 Tax=Arthrobacter oryzae TaxID=409290 RepID=UPI0016061E9C|nr:hypothetical protein [Arthrobacter oryzae]
MAGCGCEWLGDCACEVRVVPVLTPAKACKVALKTEKDRDASPKSVTADESTNH